MKTLYIVAGIACGMILAYWANFLLKTIQNNGEYRLLVETIPASATVRILSPVDMQYEPGLKVKNGRYHVEASLDGYETSEQWVKVDNSDTEIKFELKKAKIEVARDRHYTLHWMKLRFGYSRYVYPIPVERDVMIGLKSAI